MKDINRYSNLDLLRIICCISVILMHSCSYIINSVPQNTLGWYAAMTIESTGFFAVPIFFMLSGYFMLDLNKNITFKYLFNKIKHLIISLLFFSLIYIIYIYKLYIYPEQINYTNISQVYIYDLLNGHFHMWYIYYLISLYLLIPVFRVILSNKFVLKYYVTLFFIIYFIFFPLSDIPVFSYFFSFINKLNFGKLFGYSIFFLIGGIFKNYPLSCLNQKKNTLYFMGIISLMIMLIGNIIYCFLFETERRIFLNHFQPFIFIVAIAIFYFFVNFKINNKQIISLCKKISKKTLGIYYIHLIPYYILCDVGLYHLQHLGVLTILFSTLINFIISITIISILDKIPILSKYVL